MHIRISVTISLTNVIQPSRFDSDSIGRATRMVLEEDVNHHLKPHEVAKQVIAILNEEPVKPKRKATRRTPASKNICDYITDDN